MRLLRGKNRGRDRVTIDVGTHFRNVSENQWKIDVNKKRMSK